MTDKAVSPLRRRMIIQVIKNLAVFIGRSPDTASFEDIRSFQLQVAASGVGAGAINRNVSALWFFSGDAQMIRHHRAYAPDP